MDPVWFRHCFFPISRLHSITWTFADWFSPHFSADSLASPRRFVPAFRPAKSDRPVIVCFGDSITAGLRPRRREAIRLFSRRSSTRRAMRYKVVNQGTSGATTKDALAGLPVRAAPASRHRDCGVRRQRRIARPAGRGVARNLDQVLTALENAHVKILLAGITLPPDYGPITSIHSSRCFATWRRGITLLCAHAL
jgi:lysophospholipase L1-like esterase